MKKQNTVCPELDEDWDIRLLSIKTTALEKKAQAALIQKHMKSIHTLLCKGKPAPFSTMTALELLQKIGELSFYLRETGYAVFHWGLIHSHLKLITKLINLVSNERAFRMVANNNYIAVRWLINSILQSNVEISQELISIKCNILKKMVEIKPHDVYYHVIEEMVRECKTKDPLFVFPKEFEEIVVGLEKQHAVILGSSEVSFFALSAKEKESTKKIIKFAENSENKGVQFLQHDF